MHRKSDKDRKRESDYNVHLFLHEIFLQDKQMSKQYHEMQIPLYIQFDSPKLMNFLQATENYPPFKAAELCKQAKLHKEQAYLYIKTGKVDEAVNVLVENCSDNMKEVIDLAV